MKHSFLTLLIGLIFLAGCSSADFPGFDDQDWCYTYDFRTSDYGVAASIGSWQSGVGFKTALISPANPNEVIGLDYTHTSSVTPNFVVVTVARVTPSVSIDVEAYGTIFGLSASSTATLSTDTATLIFEGSGESGSAIDVNVQTDSQTLAIQSLEIRGNGTTPFPTNPCGAPPPTSTTAPTSTSAPTNTSMPGAPTSTIAPTNTSAPGLPTNTSVPSVPTNTNVPPVVSRSDCTTLNPCGPVPWKMPELPRLLTPTAAPISSSGAFFGSTPVIADNSGYVQDVGIDGSDLNDQIGTLNDLMNNDNTLNGTDQDLGSLVNNSGDFFGYLRAFASADLGPWTPILAVTILGFGLRMGLALATTIIPIVVSIYGLIRKAITLILDFLPL